MKQVHDASYGLNFGLGGPMGEYLAFWGPIKGNAANLVQGLRLSFRGMILQYSLVCPYDVLICN